MGLYMLAFIGGTPIGAPVIGALTNHFGARAGMAICGAVPALAAVLVAAATKRRPGVQRSAMHGTHLHERQATASTR
jgi:predicted MFS family arabinose efflux permease